MSPRCFQLEDVKKVICLFVLRFLHLEYMADDIWPVSRTVWRLPDYIKASTIHEGAWETRKRSVHEKHFKVTWHLGRNNMLLEMSPTGIQRYIVCKQRGDTGSGEEFGPVMEAEATIHMLCNVSQSHFCHL